MTPDVHIYEVQDERRCYDCGVDLGYEGSRFLRYMWTQFGRNGRQTAYVARVCRHCSDAGMAELDAQVEGRRYTRVDVVNRCACGRPAVVAIGGYCVACWREWRMLENRQRKIRYVARLIKQLRQEARRVDELRQVA